MLIAPGKINFPENINYSFSEVQCKLSKCYAKRPWRLQKLMQLSNKLLGLSDFEQITHALKPSSVAAVAVVVP